MKRLHFDDYTDFASDIADKFKSIEDKYGDVAVIAKYEDAKEIIRELAGIGFDIFSVEIHSEEIGNYYEPYIISLDSDGIWCEKFMRETGYITDESEIIYIMDDCPSGVIKHCDGGLMYEASVGWDEYDCIDDYKDTDPSDGTQDSAIYISRSKDGKPNGFSKTWATVKDGYTCYSSYSHYSNSLEMLKEVASDFGLKL